MSQTKNLFWIYLEIIQAKYCLIIYGNRKYSV